MPANTSRYSLPYPVGTDKVGIADAVVQSLAETTENRIAVTPEFNGAGRRAYSLCTYNEKINGGTGYIVIQTNIPINSGSMMTLNISGYFYQADNNYINIDVTFYAFTDSNIYSARVVNRGSFDVSAVQIMSRTSDGKIAIALSSPSGIWNYPKFVVDGIFGHASLAESVYTTGWGISRVANLTAYTVKSTPLAPRPAGEDTGWITPVLNTGWTQYGIDWTCQYRRIGGVVYLRGLLVPAPSSNTVMFNLPVGFRPVKNTLRFSIDTNQSRLLYVYAGGDVVYPGGTSGAWTSLEGVTFPCE